MSPTVPRVPHTGQIALVAAGMAEAAAGDQATIAASILPHVAP